MLKAETRLKRVEEVVSGEMAVQALIDEALKEFGGKWEQGNGSEVVKVGGI